MSALPYLKFAGPLLDEATIAGVADVLRSGHIASGPWVRRFEDSLSQFCGDRPVRVLTSATAAVEVALQLAGIGPGDEVITCAQSFFTVLNMIVKVGATPVFVDCDLVTRNLDLARGRSGDHAAHERDHADALAGLASRPRPPYALARARGLRVIEDAALVMGSRWKGPQRRRDRRPRHVQLPSEQEHHVDRRRRTGRERRGRSRARRVAALPRHRLPRGPHARRRVSRRQVQPARRQRAHRLCAARCSCRNSSRVGARWPSGISSAFATDPGMRAAAASATGRRPVLEHVERAAAARRNSRIDRRQFRDALEARGIGHRCIVRGAAPVHARPQRTAEGRVSFPNTERIARETVTLPLHAAMTVADVDRVCGRRRRIVIAGRRDSRRRHYPMNDRAHSFRS